MQRKIDQQSTGYTTKDGAGVNLVRVLGIKTVKAFDPILLLDSLTAQTRKIT